MGASDSPRSLVQTIIQDVGIQTGNFPCIEPFLGSKGIQEIDKGGGSIALLTSQALVDASHRWWQVIPQYSQCERCAAQCLRAREEIHTSTGNRTLRHSG